MPAPRPRSWARSPTSTTTAITGRSAYKDPDCVGTGFERLDFTYDGEGHRTAILATPASGSAVETSFRYAGDAIVAEYIDGTLVREYTTDDSGTISKVTIPAGQTGTGTYLVTWNGHGDALALYRIETSGSLTLANSYTYSTWGKPTTATHNAIADLGFRFLYVGAWDVQWDATYGLDLLYMHARHYSPSLGRFLQPDPSRLDEQSFVYAGNGPVTKTDSTGLCWYCPFLQRIGQLVQSAGTTIARFLGLAPGASALCQRHCLSVNRLAHILQRHSQSVSFAALRARATIEPATKFLSDHRILPLIRTALANPRVVSYEIRQLPKFTTHLATYAYKSPFPVGISGYGNYAYWVRVVVVDGRVVAAYPAFGPFQP